MTVTTPTLRAASRRSLFWVLATVFVLLIAVVVIVATGASGLGGTPLSATNAAPAGSKAIAEVLRQQGVTVTPSTDFGSAVTAAARGQSTVFLVDADGYLDADQLDRLADAADHLVILSPDFDTLRALAPEVAQAGQVDGVIEADCALPAVQNAGTVTGDGNGYRVVEPDAAAVECLDSRDGVHSLVQLDREDGLITVVGTQAAFANETVADRGNAAFALNLLGSTPTLVWYLPSITDATVPGAPTIAELTPGWVSTVMALLLLVAIAAAVWRGRRFGPLVIENLPVTVRASETTEGRARLYQRSSARSRALDNLRVGTIERMARHCGLPHTASVDEVLLAVASVTGQDPARVEALLVSESPHTDADLIRLSDELKVLERSVAEGVRPKQGE